MRLEIGAGARERRRGRIVDLDLERRLVAAERFGKSARISGIANRKRPPLGLVTCQKVRPALVRERGGELPAEVDRILDGGVVAEAAGGREEVGRIARVARRPLLNRSATSAWPAIQVARDKTSDSIGAPTAASNIAFASASVIRAGSSPSRSWVWKANSPLPSTAAMSARRCRFKVTFIQAGSCGTTS